MEKNFNKKLYYMSSSDCRLAAEKMLEQQGSRNTAACAPGLSPSDGA